MSSEPCLRVYDTFKIPGEMWFIRWFGAVFGMRYMVIEGGRYPYGEIVGFGPTPGLALAISRWFLRRKGRREAKKVDSGYPPLVREDCDTPLPGEFHDV